jgi:hypothetical protein
MAVNAPTHQKGRRGRFVWIVGHSGWKSSLASVQHVTLGPI